MDELGTPTTVVWSPNKEHFVVGSMPGLWLYQMNNITTKPYLLGNVDDRVSTVAFAANGLLAVGYFDGHVKLWDIETKQEVATLTLGKNRVLKVAFDSTGAVLLGGDSSGIVKLWNMSIHKEISHLDVGLGTASDAFAFSPDGSVVAMASSSDLPVSLWDLKTGERILWLEKYSDSDHVWSLVFSPDGKTLATGSEDRTIRLWSIATGQNLATLADQQGSIRDVTFNASGSLLAAVDVSNQVVIWQVKEQKQQETFQTKFASSVVFHPDSNLLAVIGHQIEFRNLKTRQTQLTLQGYSLNGNVFSFSPDGTTLATASDGLIHLWSLQSGIEQTSWTAHSENVGALIYAHKTPLLASGGSDNTIILWNTLTNEQKLVLRGHTNPISNLAFDSRDKILVSASLFTVPTEIRLWDVSSGNLLVGIHDGDKLTISEDGTKLAFTQGLPGDGRSIHIWDIATQKELLILEGHDSNINALAFSYDGQLLASQSQDHNLGINIWDTQSGNLLFTLIGQAEPAGVLTFNKDRTLLASISYTEIILWDIMARKQTFAIPYQGNSLSLSAAFNHDGTVLAVGNDSTRLINTYTGKDLALLSECGANANIVFSPNGQLLTCFNSGLRVWGVSN